MPSSRGIVSSAIALASFASSLPTSVAVSEGCAAGVHIIAAYGTEVPQSVVAGFQGLAGQVSGKLGGQSSDVCYNDAWSGAADSVANWEASAEWKAYTSSEMSATANLTQEIISYAQKCPTTKIVLLGYSMGAQVVMDTLCGTSAEGFGATGALDQQWGGHVAGAVVFGDAGFTKGSGAGAFSAGSGASGFGKGGFAGVSSPYGAAGAGNGFAGAAGPSGEAGAGSSGQGSEAGATTWGWNGQASAGATTGASGAGATTGGWNGQGSAGAFGPGGAAGATTGEKGSAAGATTGGWSGEGSAGAFGPGGEAGATTGDKGSSAGATNGQGSAGATSGGSNGVSNGQGYGSPSGTPSSYSKRASAGGEVALGYTAGTATTNGRFPRIQNSCSAYAARIRSYCDEGDFLCASGLSMDVHWGYAAKYNGDAASWIAQVAGGFKIGN